MAKKVDFIWIWSFVILSCFTACQQSVSIIINELPENSLLTDSLYFASSINNWQPNASKYRFEIQKDGTYRLKLKNITVPFEYKITRGSWETVETTIQGDDIPNRKGQPKETQIIQVKGWSDNYVKTSTQLSNVKIAHDAFPMTKLNTQRKIWICLPSDYETSDKHYPVLYMHDGQNLFDALKSFSGEWEVDETMQRLEKEKELQLIIVGIENSEDRNNEYTPYINEEYGGGKGAEYANFLVNELKPFIDKNYRTKSDRTNTGIMGSSLGGVISMYIGMKYSDTFGRVGLFSPAFWWSEKCYQQVEKNRFLEDTKIYMNAGLDEHKWITEGTKTMEKALLKSGYSNKNFIVNYVEGGTHSESFWKAEFPKAILWLFK